MGRQFALNTFGPDTYYVSMYVSTSIWCSSWSSRKTSSRVKAGNRADGAPRYSAEYQLSGVAYQEQEYLEARERLEAAARIQQIVVKFHPATSATLLKLACV